MSIKKSSFGVLDDGREVHTYTLKNANGIKVKIADYGATILKIETPDKKGRFTDIVLGFDSIDSYVHAEGYLGAVVGRFANRIAEGRFNLDGKEYVLAKNNEGVCHLHGGDVGFSAKIWGAETFDGDEPSVVFTLVSPDGDEGYPGCLNARVTYRLDRNNRLSIRYEATTDKKTIINLTNHSYFNLGGYASGNIYGQQLWIDADTFVVCDNNLIPTGEIASVKGTPLDFTEMKAIGRDINSDFEPMVLAGGYDHCFNFVGGESEEVKLRACAKDRGTGRTLRLYTNQPCVQLYTANFLGDPDFPLKGGLPQAKQTAFCLETQCMPDSINHKNFTDCTLDVGEKYDYTTVFEFGVE